MGYVHKIAMKILRNDDKPVNLGIWVPYFQTKTYILDAPKHPNFDRPSSSDDLCDGVHQLRANLVVLKSRDLSGGPRVQTVTNVLFL